MCGSINAPQLHVRTSTSFVSGGRLQMLCAVSVVVLDGMAHLVRDRLAATSVPKA